jgi:hypothetical protein
MSTEDKDLEKKWRARPSQMGGQRLMPSHKINGQNLKKLNIFAHLNSLRPIFHRDPFTIHSHYHIQANLIKT